MYLIVNLLYIQAFLGNHNADTVVTNQVTSVFEAVTVRLHPQTWHRWISMRVELFGCPGTSRKIIFRRKLHRKPLPILCV